MGKGIPRTQEVKDKISKTNKGKWCWIKGKTFEEVYGIEKAKKMKLALSKRSRKQHSGIKLSEEHKNNISKGNMGRIFTKETRDKISKSNTGKKHSKETKRKLSLMFRGEKSHLSKLKGKKSYSWKGGITSLVEMIRHSALSKHWRETVYKRDNYTCQECFKRGSCLCPHHKVYFSEILRQFLNEYNQFSPIEDKETLMRLAIKYEPFWDINNGKTLCEECHKKIHEEVLSG